MQLRSELRRRLRSASTQDVLGVIAELEREVDSLGSEAAKAERLFQIGLLCEETIPARARALVMLDKASKLAPQDPRPLTRAREIFQEVGLLDKVVKLAEKQLASEKDAAARAQLQATLGIALLDLGERDRASEVLGKAADALPESLAVRDALAAAAYDRDEWMAEAERLASEAEKKDSATAARMCLRAARILRQEMPEDPAYEQMLRKVLSFDAGNEPANGLLEALLAKDGRWEDLAEHQEQRAFAAPEEARASLYRRFALAWLERFKDRERAAELFAKAIDASLEAGVPMPSFAAGMILCHEVLGARDEWTRFVELADRALKGTLVDDDRHLVALLAADVAERHLADAEMARGYQETVRRLAAEAPSVTAGASASPAPAAAALGGGSTPVVPSAPAPAPAAAASPSPAPVAPASVPAAASPAAAAPAAAPPAEALPAEETISDAQRALMAVAEKAEAAGPDKAIDAWKKAIAADPTKRAPRRELARVVRKAERWNALVELLKDEEAKACASTDAKVAVLLEMAEIYRERLRLDVMVASTLGQVAKLQPDNLPVLDQLAAQYEAMKRWPDLVATLNKKAPLVADVGARVALYLRIAGLYIEKFSNQAEAVKAFEAALALDPDNVEAATHLKQVYERQRNWEKLIALDKREVARVADPTERLRRAVELAKLASEKLKKPAVSIEAWSDVLALDASNADALTELEKLYEREKQWEALADVCARQADLAPDPARKVASLQKLGILFTEKLSDTPRAVEAWKKLLAVEPENRRGQDALKKLYVAGKAWGDLEAFYDGQGKLDEYLRVLERQVELEDDKTKIELWDKIALLYRDRLQKADRAMRAFEKVLSLDEKNLAAAEALIPLYEGAKDAKKLAGVLEIQLAQTEDPPARKERMRHLAALCEQGLKDKAAAFGWWLKAFEEDAEDEAIRGEAERLAGETSGWEPLVEAYERAYPKLSAQAALPLMGVVARAQEKELGETDKALATNQKILEIDDTHAEALDALERLYLVKQQYAELLAICSRKLELTVDDDAKKRIQYRIGQLYEDEIGDDAKAAAAYGAILESSGEEREALAALDRIHVRCKAWRELADVLVRQLALVPEGDHAAVVALKFRLGAVREEHLGDVPGAIDCYRDILELDATHEGARVALEKRLGEEEHQLAACAILEPIYGKLEAWAKLVEVHEIDLRREAMTDRRVELLLKIGELQSAKLGDADRAFDAYARTLKDDPSRAEARAELERLAGLLDEGWPKLVALYEGALERGAELDPTLLHELETKTAGVYEERLENTAKAIEHWRRALAVEPEDPAALEALERLYSREEKYPELLEIYRRKVELARDAAERLGLLLRIASIWEEMLGNAEEAIVTYREILGQEPENLRALKALDRLFLGQKHWQDLGDNLVRQLALVEDKGEQVVLLGRLAALRERELGEVAAAVDTYRQVIDLQADHAEAIVALERLIALPEHELTIAGILEPVYQASGAWEKQIGVFEIMARHAFDPARKIELLHRIGELYEVGGEDADRAFTTYARALKEDPAGADTQGRLERLARVHDKWRAYVELLDEVIGLLSDDELKVALLAKLAHVYELELGRDEDAVKTYARILGVDPRNLEAATAVQAIHERNTDYPRLVEALKRKSDILEDVPERKALLYKAAQIEEEILENLDASIATFRSVLGIDEVDATAMDALERLYIRLERWSDLKDIYAKKADLAQSPEDRMQMLFVLGQVYDRELGDVTKAIETYQAILEIDPDELAAIQALDRLYGQAARWYDLLGILDREVELSGSSGETVALKHRIGQLWEKELKDLARAIEAYREALTLDPQHAPTIAALDALLHGEGEPVLAAQVLEPIYEQSAEFERLIDVYEVMAAHAEETARKVELLHTIADLYEKRLDRYEKAFEAHGRALREDPSHEPTILHLERLADAIRSWEPLAQLYEGELGKTLDVPRQVDLLLRLARVYEEELGQAEKAIATYRRVLDVEAENRQAVLALDRLYDAAQRWPDLAEVLRKESRLAATDAEIIAIEFRLGQVLELNLRDLPGAIEVYRGILEKDPGHGPTLGALELLFLEGNYQLEIAAILEPLYETSAEWEKLHKLHEVQLQKLVEVAERQAMYQRLAELAEAKLVDAVRAFQWWGAAFREDPRSERAAEDVERLAGATSSWDDLVAVYTDVLARRAETDIQKAVLLKVARVYDQEIHDATRAEESYLRVLGLDEKEPQALEALDRIYELAGMYSELAEILKRRVGITDALEDIITLYFRLGRIQSDVLGELDAAVETYEKVLEQDSRNRTALESLERVYFRREEWQKLFDIYEKMVDIAKGDAELADVYAHMARLASDALSDDDKAVDLWSRVIDLRGEDAVGLLALGEIYERREMWRDLVDVLERRVAIAPTLPEKVALHKRLGRVWSERLGRERNSLEAWLRAYELAPQDLETLRALATLYRATQAWEELSETLRRLIEAGQVSGQVTEDDLIGLYGQLGQLEGEVLGRVADAVEAWRRVIALDPSNLEALAALESLFTREMRWEDCIDVLEKRALILDDKAAQLDTLLQAASIWEERVGDKVRAAHVYERVRAADETNSVASAQLEAIYRSQYNWEKLSEVLLERVEHTDTAGERIALLQEVAKIYEEEQGDPDSAFVVLQAAFKEDYAYEPVAKSLERLATTAGKWEELLADYSQVVSGLEHEEPAKAADLWVKIGRWYGDHLGHVDYAIHSVNQALRLDARHLGALGALADFHRKRQAWTDLVEVLDRHAGLEPDAQKRVELYLGLADLLENRMQDPMRAMSAYRSALEADAVCADALESLDRLYRRGEMWEQLIEILGKKADLASDPDERVRLKLEIGRHWDERLNEPVRAIEAFRSVLDLDARSLPALRALERLYERTGQSEQYLDILEMQLDATPTDAEKIGLYQRMASAWEERFGKLDRAAECLEKILVLDERHLPTYRDLERLYRQEKKWDSQVDTLRRHILAAGDPGTRIDLYCAMGQVYEEELGDADRAIEAYNDVLSFDPDEPRALDALGRLYERIEDWDRAIATMGRHVETTDDPRLRVELYHRVGRILDERLGDPGGAEERYLQALNLDPAHVPTMMSLTSVYKARGDWQKAVAMMARAEQQVQHPLEKIRLLFDAGQITHRKLGDESRAAEFYAATIALDPEHVEAGEPLSDVYFREERWAELAPILDMLVRKAGQLKKDNRSLNELFYRTARCADALGENEKALKFYKQAYDLDSTFLPTLLGRAGLLYKMEDWEGAGKIYQTILVQHREAQKDHEVVEIYHRLGQVRLKLGERKKALNMFEKALEIDATHRATLLALIDLQAQGGDWEAVIHAKRSLLVRADEEERFKILEEIGDLYQEKLQNPQKSIAAYLEGLELKPKNHQLLQKLLDRYTETEQWKKAVEVALRFTEIEPNPLVRGRYFYAAGVWCRDKVKALDEAVEYWNQALDCYFAEPEKIPPDNVGSYLKAFEAIDRILTNKKDWKELERAYRRMIKRMPQRQGDKLLTMLWHNLGEIYRTRQKDFKTAAQAFEVAAKLDPDNKTRHEILAELYVACGPDYAEKAVQQHMTMLKTEPFKIDSYKALRRIYMDAHQYDKAWCVCNTLAFLKKADPEEQQFFEQYRPKGFVRTNRRITDDSWRKIFHPDEDRFVSAIFGAIWQAAALVRAQPHKAFGLKRKDRRPIETDQLVFSKVFYWVAQVLNVPMPEVFIQPEQPGEMLLANCDEKGTLIPSFVVRGHMLQGTPEKEVAFVAAKYLTYMRPEHYLKLALPTNTELKTAFLSALVMVQPNFPLKQDMVPLVQQYLPVLNQRLHQMPQFLEQLHIVVKRFLQNPTEIDLVKWGNAVEATGHRVGFILSGDLEVAAKRVSMEPLQVGAPQAKEKIKELVLFSVSEDYFAVRQQLGTVIG